MKSGFTVLYITTVISTLDKFSQELFSHLMIFRGKNKMTRVFLFLSNLFTSDNLNYGTFCSFGVFHNVMWYNLVKSY